MSRESSYTCDVCGGEIVGRLASCILAERITVSRKDQGDYRWQTPQKHLLVEDLCEECFVSLEEFLQARKKEEEK